MRPAFWTITVLTAAAMFSACRESPDLTSRLKVAGGADALKSECLRFVAAYEASSGQQFTWFPDQTNYPPTVAALHPRTVQVGKQGDVVLVHLGFVIGPHPYGIYVAPRGCPTDFAPKRPFGSRITKLAEGVFQYED